MIVNPSLAEGIVAADASSLSCSAARFSPVRSIFPVVFIGSDICDFIGVGVFVCITFDVVTSVIARTFSISTRDIKSTKVSRCSLDYAAGPARRDVFDVRCIDSKGQEWGNGTNIERGCSLRLKAAELSMQPYDGWQTRSQQRQAIRVTKPNIRLSLMWAPEGEAVRTGNG